MRTINDIYFRSPNQENDKIAKLIVMDTRFLDFYLLKINPKINKLTKTIICKYYSAVKYFPFKIGIHSNIY